MTRNKLHIILALLPVLIIYLFLPTSNSTTDAYAYASYIRYGTNLFDPFHVFYNVLGFIIYRTITFVTTVDVLSMMKVVNSFAAVSCLYLLYNALSNFIENEGYKIWLVIFCSVSFGVLRYATENETYIVPTVFSLAASCYYFRYLNNSSHKTLLLAGFYATIACLFHVIHVFWLIGLMYGVYVSNKKAKTVLLFFLPVLILPVVYLMVIPVYQNCSLSVACLRSYFYNISKWESIRYTIGWDNLYLGVINFFRTFYQVHGNIYLLIKNNLFLTIPAFMSIVLALFAVRQLWREKLLSIIKPQPFITTHLLIFILQLLFAFYSTGNAEFMVMLPFLLVIIGGYYIVYNKIFLVYTCTSLFIWNICFGLLPNHYSDFTKREKLVEMIRNKPANIYMVEHYYDIQNKYFYQTGVDTFSAIVDYPENKELMEKLISHASLTGADVYTDFCENKALVIDRYALTKKKGSNFLNTYKFEKVDSFVNFYGKTYIFKLNQGR